MSPALQPNSEALSFMLLTHIDWAELGTVGVNSRGRVTYGTVGAGHGSGGGGRQQSKDRDSLHCDGGY